MAKNVLKEIMIILLMTLAIILILGVLLYEYVPSNKIIPEEVSYITPADIKAELEKEDAENSNELVLTYQLEPTDMSNYARIDSYVPGKVNPFSSYEQPVQVPNENGESNGSGTSGGNANANSGETDVPNNNNTNVPNNAPSEGRFLPNEGTK